MDAHHPGSGFEVHSAESRYSLRDSHMRLSSILSCSWFQTTQIVSEIVQNGRHWQRPNSFSNVFLRP